MAANDQVPILQCVKQASAREILNGGSPSRSGLRICSLKQPTYVTVAVVAGLSGCGGGCCCDILSPFFVCVRVGCVLADVNGGMEGVFVKVLLWWQSGG